MYDFLDEGVTYEGLNQYLKRKADWLEEVENKYSDTTKRTYWILLNTRVNFLELSKEKELYDWNKQEIIQTIKDAAPHILLVALGAPKQELWIKKYKNQLNVPVCIGVGGSFDVLAGHKKRAPQIMIKLNIEWLYRLISEPSRFKRQLVLPKFALAVMRQKGK
jgi:exopolysaccharide biosynthesis WecB/TagA/CpsF family protein